MTQDLWLYGVSVWGGKDWAQQVASASSAVQASMALP